MESVKEIMRLPAQAAAEIWMPVLSVADAITRRNLMVEVAQQLMAAGVDYGVIPGTGSKPVLLKPGAEKLCSLFGLSPEIPEEYVIEDWTGGEHSGEPFFYYRFKCRVTKNGILLGEGIGSANSWEVKYRYRTAERKCPRCGAPAIIKGKEEYGGGWLCFAKKGGCGAKFKPGDPAIEAQSMKRVANAEIFDQVNTIQKMAHKRALVAAVLIATNASEFFTQDVENMDVIDIPVAEEPTNSFREMIEAFGRLKEQLVTACGPKGEALYYNILLRFGVEHSNQFRDMATARSCYRELKQAAENFPPVEPAAGEGGSHD